MWLSFAPPSDPSFLPRANNSELFDRNSSNQTLTHVQIEAMKKQGIKGEELIKIIAQQSKTFDKCVAASQHSLVCAMRQRFVWKLTSRVFCVGKRSSLKKSI